MTVIALKSPRKPKGSGHLRRSEILDAAQRIFFECGYEGATVRKIAEQVGVSSTAIYLHFPDKRAMLTEIAAEAVGTLLAEARTIVAEPVDARERARMMMQAYVRFAFSHRSAYTVIFSDVQGVLFKGEDAAREAFRSYFRLFVGILEELAQQNRLRAKRANLAGITLWAGCHGVCNLVISRDKFASTSPEELADSMIDTLLAGAVS